MPQWVALNIDDLYTAENTVLDYKTRYWTTKHGTGLQNTVLDYKTRYWTTKHGTGLQNTVLDYKTPYWTTKHGTGLQNTVLDYKTRYWTTKHLFTYNGDIIYAGAGEGVGGGEVRCVNTKVCNLER